MDSPSSTSSSSAAGARARVPLALLLAGLVVLAFEVSVLGPRGPWPAIKKRLDARPVQETRLEVGIATDYLELARLEAAAEGLSRVIVMGNSRAKVGLDFEDPKAVSLQGLRVAKWTHAPVSPWIMHSAVGRFLEAEPDLVVLLLSEMDTHRGVNLVPAATFGDLATVGSLVRGRGWSESWSRRDELLRVALASVLRSYRYRPVLGNAGLDDLCSFSTDSRAVDEDRALERYPSARARFERPSDELPDVPDIAAIHRDILRTSRNVRPHTMRLVSRIRVGDHSRLQAQLVEQTVSALRAAGVEVLLVEGPLNPACYPLYDREATRAEFVTLAQRLVAEQGAHFLSLDESGPFPASWFSDLLHLRETGARRLSLATLRRIRSILGLEEE